MKKTLAFIASLVLMTTAFASCGKTDDDNDSSGRKAKSSSSVDRSDDDDEDDDDDDKKSSKKDKDDEDDDDDKKSSKKDKDDEDDDDDDKKSSKKDKDDEEDDDDKKSSKKDKDDDDDKDSKPSKKSDNDITGIWIPDDAAVAELFGDMDDDFILDSMTFEFIENEIKVDATMDMSDMFCIQGDKFIMDGESFSYDYDGNVITLTFMGESLAEFKRVGKADKDNVYGKYTCDEMFGIDEDEGEIYFDFPEDNVAYMVMSMAMEYSYDEETGKLTVTDMDGEAEDMDVEISGDKMYMIDEDGEEITFIRKK